MQTLAWKNCPPKRIWAHKLETIQCDTALWARHGHPRFWTSEIKRRFHHLPIRKSNDIYITSLNMWAQRFTRIAEKKALRIILRSFGGALHFLGCFLDSEYRVLSKAKPDSATTWSTTLHFMECNLGAIWECHWTLHNRYGVITIYRGLHFSIVLWTKLTLRLWYITNR